MNTKITVSMIVGIVVATILTMGILSPVIQDVSTDYESVDNEGSSWIRMVYQTSPVDFDVDFSVDNGTVEISDGAGSQSGSGDTILYADSNMSVWIQDGSVHLLGKTATSTISGTLSDGFSVSGDSEGVTVSDGPDGGLGVYVFPVPTYQFIPAEGGRYGFFPNGTNVLNVPSDLPLATTGSYAGVDVYNDTNNLDISIYMHDSGDEGYINGVVWDDTEPVASVPEESEPELAPTSVPVGGSEENILYGAGSTPVLRSVPPTPTYTDGDWGYNLSGSDATIVSYSGPSGIDITIPSTVGGYNVKGIGGGSTAIFDTSLSFNSLVISSGIVNINNSAFAYCSFSGTLTLPNGIETIGNSAFYKCSGFIGNLNLPATVISIEGGAFSKCTGFTGTLTIPSSATISGSEAFTGCTGFTTLVLPEGLINLGSISTFSGCTGFTGTLTIPSSVTRINDDLFSGCSGFTALELSENLTTIGQSVFQNCSNLTGTLTIPSSVTFIGISAFKNCSKLTGLQLSNNITRISVDTFSGCTGFTGTLTIPSSVTSIGMSAFYNCSGFTGSLTIPEGVTNIDASAFYNCSGFTGSLIIPEGVTSIGTSAFNKCSGLDGSLTIPTTVASIGRQAFQNCSNLTGTLTIPSSVTSIELRTFDGCSKLTGSLEIPEGVTTINNYAFYRCSGLSGIIFIPKSVTTIGDYVFSGCSDVKGLVVSSEAVPSTHTYQNTANLKEVLNLGSAEYTTTSYGLNADSIQDHIDSIGYLGCTSYEETIQKDGALYVVLAILPVVVLAGIAFATLGLIYIRKD